MEDFAALLSWTFRIFDLHFTLYGFTFSWWQVFAFGAVTCIVGKILAEVFLVIDDPGIYMPDWDPTPIPDPVPAVTLDPEPTPEPEPAPALELEEPSAPIEVIPVEDLLDRLTGGSQNGEEVEEPPQEAEEEDPSGLPDTSGVVLEGSTPIEVIGMDTALKRLKIIQGTVDHPLLTTPFEDYTATEGLLLLLFLSVVVAACVKMLKGGFAWLR